MLKLLDPVKQQVQTEHAPATKLVQKPVQPAQPQPQPKSQFMDFGLGSAKPYNGSYVNQGIIVW